MRREARHYVVFTRVCQGPLRRSRCPRWLLAFAEPKVMTLYSVRKPKSPWPSCRYFVRFGFPRYDLSDPSGNALEFKAFADDDQVFAT